MTERPIARELSERERADRREDLLAGLVERASAVRRLPNGFRWRFDSKPDLLRRIAAVIDAERRCCRFLRFRLDVEPAGGPVWLEVTGPEGTVAFLSQWMKGPAS